MGGCAVKVRTPQKLTQLTTPIARHPPRFSTCFLRALFVALFFHKPNFEDNSLNTQKATCNPIVSTHKYANNSTSKLVCSIDNEALKECSLMAELNVQVLKCLFMV